MGAFGVIALLLLLTFYACVPKPRLLSVASREIPLRSASRLETPIRLFAGWYFSPYPVKPPKANPVTAIIDRFETMLVAGCHRSNVVRERVSCSHCDPLLNGNQRLRNRECLAGRECCYINPGLFIEASRQNLQTTIDHGLRRTGDDFVFLGFDCLVGLRSLLANGRHARFAFLGNLRSLGICCFLRLQPRL